MQNISFGVFFKQLRLKTGLSLRQFCLQHGIDSSNISKIERGVANPPQEEKLHEYAKYLGLKKESDEWYRFCDLAAAERGRFPKDLISDKEVMRRMPALFRSLRKEETPKKIIQTLKDVVKEAWKE